MRNDGAEKSGTGEKKEIGHGDQCGTTPFEAPEPLSLLRCTLLQELKRGNWTTDGRPPYFYTSDSLQRTAVANAIVQACGELPHSG